MNRDNIERMDVATRRLLEVDVHYISLVGIGANLKAIIWKSLIDTSEFDQSKQIEKTINIIKADSERHMVYGIVYSPDEVDAKGDTASATVIENMAFNYMRNGRTPNIDREHDYDNDEGFVAESWIEGGGKRMFPEEKEGTWAVGIKVENETTWAAIKDGRIGGISLAGYAQTEDIKDNIEQKSIIKKVRDILSISDKPIMDEKKIKDVINILQELIGDNKMANKDTINVNEEKEKEIKKVKEEKESKEETDNTTEINDDVSENIQESADSNLTLSDLVAVIDNDNLKDDSEKETDNELDLSELVKQFKELKENNINLQKKIDILEKSSNGLLGIDAQENNNSTKKWAPVNLVPSQFK